jgi:antagonist of KipI
MRNEQPVAMWKPFFVRAGDQLKIGVAKKGYRGYVAVRGGIQVEPILGSRSMYGRAHGFPELLSRPLREQDELPMQQLTHSEPFLIQQEKWKNHVVTFSLRPDYWPKRKRIRVFPGAEYARFTKEWIQSFCEQTYTVTPQSDRMGIRFSGIGIQSEDAGTMVSAPAAIGNVQIPPHGQPIVLCAEGQTIGGYPRIAQVASVDMAILAQTMPGEFVQFEWISVEEAERLADEQIIDLQALTVSLNMLR